MKQLLDLLLASYCLYSTVQFPTRILNNSSTAINKIFINKFKKDNFTVYSRVNGLSGMMPRSHWVQIFVALYLILSNYHCRAI